MNDRWCEKLGAAVLALAAEDARRLVGPPCGPRPSRSENREIQRKYHEQLRAWMRYRDAVQFLGEDSEDLRFWATVSGVSCAAIIAKYQPRWRHIQRFARLRAA